MRQTRISIVNTRNGTVEESKDIILPRAVERIHRVGRDKPDIILMPEMFANSPEKLSLSSVEKAAQTVPGPISEELAPLARKYQTYIAFGLLRSLKKGFYNSLVLLDRRGKHVWDYDKVTPVVVEMTRRRIIPGKRPEPFACDFGSIGGAICFDINFLELAELYSRQSVELILFSSAFPGGRLLDIWATLYGFAVAGSTYYDHNRIIDCTGTTVGRTSDIIPLTTAVLNLNRRLVHMDGNLDKLDRMRTKYAGEVIIDDLRAKATCVITSLKKGLEVEDLIREFRIETLPKYLDRARRCRQRFGGLKCPSWQQI